MRRFGVLCLLLAALALQLGLFWIERHPEPRRLWGDEVLYTRAAGEVTAGRFPDLALLWPPLYPRLLAPLLTLDPTRRLVELVQTGLLVLVALAVAGVGSRLFGRPAGWLAAGFVLVYPPLAAYGHYLWPEILHLALFLPVVWILLARPPTTPWLLATGALVGLALLTKSILGPFLPVLLLPLLVPREAGEAWRRRLARPAVVVATALAILAPTLIEHQRRYGQATIADSGPFNLAVGLADRSRRNLEDEAVGDAYGRYLASAATPRERNRLLGEGIRERLRAQGLLATLGSQLGRQYFRLLDTATFLDDMLPGGAIQRRGSGYPATPPTVAALLSGASALLYTALLLGATAGIAMSPWRRPGVGVLLAFVGYNLLLFLGLHTMTRYRIQLEPVLALFAAHAVTSRAELARRLRSPRFTILLVGAVALVLFLAWGGSWLGRLQRDPGPPADPRVSAMAPAVPGPASAGPAPASAGSGRWA